MLYFSVLFGQELVATIAAALTGGAVLCLSATYRQALQRHGIKDLPPERRRLDVVVRGDALAVTGVGAAVGSLSLILGHQNLDVGVASAVIVPLLIIAAIVYTSSLVDWFVTVPRISGLLGPRPCRDRAARFDVFPSSWKETTRIWLLHRAVAAFVVRFGLGFAITLAVSDVANLGFSKILVGTGVLGGFASYVQSIPFATFGRPKMSLGQTVMAPIYEQKKAKLPVVGHMVPVPFRYSKVEDPGVRKYVYDVAVEGYQLVGIGPFERTESPQADFQGDPGAPIPLSKAYAGTPVNDSELDFRGCQYGRCSKINWYCIENPRCFQTK